MTEVTAAVTGSGSENSRGVAQSLFAAGWRVALAARNASKPADVAAGAVARISIVSPTNVAVEDELGRG